MSRRKILVLTPRFPYPVIGGDRLRIYQICKALSVQADITLLSLCDSQDEMQISIEDAVFNKVERFYLPKWQSYLHSALALLTGSPLQIAYYRHRKFYRRAQELMRTHDTLLAHLIRVGDGVRDLPGRKFLEMTDAISLNYARVKENASSRLDWRAKVFAMESRRLIEFERQIVDYFEESFLVSDIDRDYLFPENQNRRARVSVFSNGVDLDKFPFQFSEQGHDIAFIGNLHSLQNYEGAFFFAKEVLPLIRERIPTARFRIIGRIKPDQAAALANFDNVVVTGEVESIAQAAKFSRVGVCSIRLGAGVQNKVLEYMALGLPVVSTSVGLEGFKAEPGRDLLVADEAETIASSVIYLLSHIAEAAAMAKSARRYVEENHSWDAMLRPLVFKIVQAP